MNEHGKERFLDHGHTVAAGWRDPRSPPAGRRSSAYARRSSGMTPAHAAASIEIAVGVRPSRNPRHVHRR